MLRGIIIIALLANGLLFAFGIWRSVMQGQQAFHTIGDLFGSSGGLMNVWLWPLGIILFALLLARQSRSGDYDD
ncbi:MAG: hypothetical protein JKY46_08320 [Robiginitomaculum sp.]|nr:hypothetical protein [Robiginitomaculum sp.]